MENIEQGGLSFSGRGFIYYKVLGYALVWNGPIMPRRLFVEPENFTLNAICLWVPRNASAKCE